MKLEKKSIVRYVPKTQKLFLNLHTTTSTLDGLVTFG